jgi:serine protease
MRPITVTLTSFLAAMALITTASAAERNPARTRPSAVAEQESAQRIIVKFRQSSLSIQATKSGESVAATAADTTRMNALANRTRITVRGTKALGGDMHVMQVSTAAGETAAETLSRLRADSDVEFAELDRRVYLHATDPNDTRYLLNSAADAGQWYLREAQPSSINARAAWDITKGSNGVVIAVVDTGVRYEHEDLQPAATGGKLLPGFDFVSQDSANNFSTAGDGDARDSDPSDPGDFCTSSADSSSWHGTRVSGIIAARTNNNLGVAGINWNGYILPVRVLGRCGGFNSDVIACIRWAAGLSVPGAPTNPYPAQVINISLGSEGACDQGSAAAISAATGAGSLVVVSAGNEGGPVDSPASCPGAMAILGLRHAGTKVGFSSLGQEIALGAPGGNCVNTAAGTPCVYSIDTTTNTGASTPGANGYTDKSSGNTNVGTSFSSPIVSGIAGLMLSVNGNLKSRQLIARMREGAKPYPTTSDSTGTVPQCQDPFAIGTVQGEECICNTAVCGAGMANALGAVTAALRPIAAVTVPATYAAGSSITLTGSASAACGRTISTYSWTSAGAVISSSPNATLTAPASAIVVRLTVTDDAGKTDFADVTVGPTAASSTAPATAGATACLTDITPPAGVTITATDASAAEAGTDPGVFTITRTGSTAAALTVNLAFSGSATNGTDNTMLSTTASIPAGSASTTVTVTPFDDTVVEGAETVVATVQTGSGYQIGDSSSATVTIADNDTAAAPPPNNGGGGGGGGGALDLLTLLGAAGFAMLAVLRRLRAVRARY